MCRTKDKCKLFFILSINPLQLKYKYMKNITIMKILTLILVASPIVTSAAMLTRQLQFGMSGSDVSTLQSFLAQDRTIYPQGLVTGYFGYLTRSAVSNFQARNGIATVGRVGPITMAAINARIGGTAVGPARIIGQLSVGVLNNQATVGFNTSRGTTAALYYSTSPLTLTEATEFTSFSIGGGSNIVMNSDFRTAHSGTVTGLSPNTVYNYVVHTIDAAGNESITLPATFRTAN